MLLNKTISLIALFLVFVADANAANKSPFVGNWKGSIVLQYSSCDMMVDSTVAVPLLFSVAAAGDELKITINDDGEIKTYKGARIQADSFSAWFSETDATSIGQGAFTVEHIRKGKGRLEVVGTVNFGGTVCAFYYKGSAKRN